MRRTFPLNDNLIGIPSTGPRYGAAALLPHNVVVELFEDEACTVPVTTVVDEALNLITSITISGVTIPTFLGPDDTSFDVVYGRPAGEAGDGFRIDAKPLSFAELESVAVPAPTAEGFALYLYGNSHALIDGAPGGWYWFTDGEHYADLIAEALGLASITSYAQGGRRLFELTNSMLSVDPPSGMSAFPAGAEWPGESRKGIVILEADGNTYHHAPVAATAIPTPLVAGDYRYQEGMRGNLRLALALASTASRIEAPAPPHADYTGVWANLVLGGSSATAYTSAADASVAITVPAASIAQNGPLAGMVWVVTYTPGGAFFPPSEILFDVDGEEPFSVYPLQWEDYVGHTGATVGSCALAYPVKLPVDGAAHVIHMTHKGAGGTYLYYDSTLCASENPNPIVVPIMERATSGPAGWTAAQVSIWRRNAEQLRPTIYEVLAEFPNAIAVDQHISLNALNVTDGVHRNDRGQRQAANAILHALATATPWFRNRLLELAPDSDFTTI